MCKYCEKITDRNGEKRTDIMTSDWGEFSIETFHGVLVFEDSVGARLEINYCPMCGRDLKGEGQSISELLKDEADKLQTN